MPWNSRANRLKTLSTAAAAFAWVESGEPVQGPNRKKSKNKAKKKRIKQEKASRRKNRR